MNLGFLLPWRPITRFSYLRENASDFQISLKKNCSKKGYNPELSNKPFDKKRDILLESNLQLKEYFKDKINSNFV